MVMRKLGIFALGSLLVSFTGVADADAKHRSRQHSTHAAGSGGSGSADITIKDFEFTGIKAVQAGATVTVHNDGPSEHTVTADGDGGFDVTIPSGEDATLTAPDTAGAYKFHCSIHPQMKATLTVE